ncbi:ribose-phosphate pyrophosphokinase [Pseudomonas phage vB_PseuGesM_254]|uniref:Ribose-phosphate pyrophosphokinase n=1 Tax=Pseudomonas phage vB_PseuGesM_254 TaxID=3092638 RepID=A0AAX4G6A8_9CAUD|nr:ribose-phosphate pyrophosphokinase [Pseudomonas phage PseuGes_254]
MIYLRTKHWLGSKEVQMTKFPGGEVGPKIPEGSTSTGEVWLTAVLKNSDDIMQMLLVVNAIRQQNPKTTIYALIPYVPYARQDRVCDEGEALSIQVMAQLINSCKFAQVTILDPHSLVTPALIENVTVEDQVSIFGDALEWSKYILVAPDAGARKKVEAFAKAVGAKGILYADKKREMSTGKILGIELLGRVDPSENYIVLDDICDGGRTFIELADRFPIVKSLSLVVTHGIFSKGVNAVASSYDHIYTTNSLGYQDHPHVTVLDIMQF